MILGAAILVAGNLGSIVGARAILARVRLGEPSADLVLLLVLRLLLISAAVLAGGLAHCLRGGVLGAFGLVVFLALGFRKTPVQLPRFAVSSVGPAAACLALLVGLKLLLQAWFFAPSTMDVLSYHLPKVAEWIRLGGFGGELGVDDHATFPAGFELIEAWWVLFLHHDVLIEMAGIEFLLLAAAATLALSRRLGLADKPAFLAALAAAMIPGLALQATSCLNDGAVAALALAAFALVLYGAPLPLLAMVIGLGAGVKGTFVYALPGVLLVQWLFRRDPHPRPKRWGDFALGLLGVAVGGYWYARNYVTYGNPVYPIGQLHLPIQSTPRFLSLLDNFAALANERIYDRGPYGAFLDGIAGWGGAAFACGILGLLLWMSKDLKVRKVAAGFLVSLSGVFLMARGDDWFMRFCLFFPALLAISAVYLVQVYPRALTCLWIALSFQFLGTLLPYDLSLPNFRKLAAQPWVRRNSSCFFGFEPRDSGVGYFASNRGSAYCLYGPDFGRRVIYLRSQSAESLVLDMKRAGVDLVCTPDLEPPQQKVVNECLERGIFLRVSEHTFVLAKP